MKRSPLRRSIDIAALDQRLLGLRDSPIGGIADKLRQDLAFAQIAADAGLTCTNGVAELARWIQFLLNQLPNTFGDRFDFDSLLIKAIAQSWEAGGAKIPNSIIPKPADMWGHEGTLMPSENRDNAHRLFFVLTPGADEIAHIDLLDYPFLCHELGHTLLFLNGEEFANSFEAGLKRFTNTLRLSSTADRGAALERAKRVIGEIEQFWTPTAHQRNWAHELAVDVIAVWTCGPAYLAAYAAEIDKPDVVPHEIVPTHPPHAVRVAALIEMATQLGWGNRTPDLQRISLTWNSRSVRERNNRYVALTHKHLIQAGITAAMETCRKLALPQCTAGTLASVEKAVKRGEPLPFGLALLWGAWAVWQNDPDSYEDWQGRLVRDLLARA